MKILFAAVIFLGFSSSVFATGNKSLLTIEGSVLDASNNPVSTSTATVVASLITSDANACTLWSQTFTNVSIVDGGFVLSLGAGTNTAAGSLTWTQIFQNGIPFSSLSCSSGTTYTGTATDDRNLYLTFSGTGFSSAQSVGPIALKANAQNPLIAGYPVQLLGSVPAAGNVLAFDGSNKWWYPVAPSGGSGTVSSATANQIAIYSTGGTTVSGASTLPTSVQTNITATGTITSGTWQGSTLGAIYGGTGMSSYTQGDLLYASGTSTLSALHATTAGAVLTSNGVGTTPTWQTPAAGTVTSVALTLPSIFTVSGSPVTSSGTLSATLASESQYSVFAAPQAASGSPSFRVLNAADIRSTVSGGYLPTAGCSTGSNLQYSSVSDQITCTAFALTSSQVTTALGYTPVNRTGDTMTGALANNTNSSSTALAVTQSGSGYAATFSGGNVGIGTTTPGQTLQVQGTFYTAINPTTNVTGSGSILTTAGTTNYPGGYTLISGGAAATVSYPGGTPGAIKVYGADYNGYGGGYGGDISLIMGIDGFNSPISRIMMGTAATPQMMSILNTGFVGIANTAPSYPLDVTGNMRTSGCLYYSGGSVGSCTSDQRLKKDVTPYKIGLKELVGIEPVTFKYNGLGENPDDDKKQIGVIAQQIEKVAPQLIGTKDVKLHPEDKQMTSVRTVDYGAFTYVIINAVKELYHSWSADHQALEQQKRALASVTAQAEQLSAGNAAKEKEIAELKARLDKIEKTLNSK